MLWFGLQLVFLQPLESLMGILRSIISCGTTLTVPVLCSRHNEYLYNNLSDWRVFGDRVWPVITPYKARSHFRSSVLGIIKFCYCRRPWRTYEVPCDWYFEGSFSLYQDEFYGPINVPLALCSREGRFVARSSARFSWHWCSGTFDIDFFRGLRWDRKSVV